MISMGKKTTNVQGTMGIQIKEKWILLSCGFRESNYKDATYDDVLWKSAT